MSIFCIPISLCAELQRMMNSFWWGSKPNGHRNIHWFYWDMMCFKKDAGSIGFCNLHLFNLAMLGKQGWCLVSSQHTLLCRIFKAKYFPRGDFLYASECFNPSFVWNLLQAKVVLNRGLRWRVGDGRRINVWHNPC
ncbi:hypothetical protein P3X46_011722 [Hevea brasiliensis]|uniref:Reverse transcriptase zinc-binding domain-containing protein n=1 Tax=Hevea brasiliensis TaxID=3981 RepID=A0ABQ9MBZ8_HEVBR|nr:hypothetical protein P3X46_011722 [Hevea brasiliensis]